MNQQQELIKLNIHGLSKTPCKNKHLLISSFLAVKLEDENSMKSLAGPVATKFKDLIKNKTGTYKKGLFEQTLKELSYTNFGREIYENRPNHMREDVVAEITGYSSSTVFLLSDKLKENTNLRVQLVNNDEHIISIVEPFYSIIKQYENDFDFDKCLKICVENRNNML